LVLYTYAELKGVAPDTWTAWKRLLLLELYQRTHNFLEHPDEQEVSPEYTRNVVHLALAGEVSKQDIDDHIDMMLEDYLLTAGAEDVISHIRLVHQMEGRPFVVHHRYDSGGGFYDLLVATLHSPDMFMQVVGALTSKAMNIFGAQIYTRRDDIALIHLQVEGTSIYDIHGEGDEIWMNVERTVRDLMGRRITLPKLMASRTRLTSQTESKAAIVPKVEIDNVLENKYSFMRIEARDHPGMLYKIARAFADFNIQIHRAKISCRGGRGIDVFSVSQHGEKIYHEALQRKLKDRIIANLLVEKLEDIR
jgi:[protein-PII] uridylyltransferase